MADILQEIAAYKREFVRHRRYQRPLADVRGAARDAETPRGFAAALEADGISLIAEIKKASPSRGIIRADFNPEAIARCYDEHGARALSVLTDEAYFQGCDDYLVEARQVTALPVLRKDFTIHEYQIYEARAIGADAVLIIAALMDGGQLDDFLGISRELGIDALVEVHAAAELVRAAGSGASLMGINNRDLHTFQTTLETTLDLLPGVPEHASIVSESGIHSRADVGRLEDAGVDAILVGEAFMRETDIGSKVDELLGTEQEI
jgi:indole-3-glycerol phosphate synthase